jgi:tetratricopeptide (TPR) repeat protein
LGDNLVTFLPGGVMTEYLELAEQALTAGDYRTAQEMYEHLLDTPRRAIALQGLVKVFREEERLDAARRLLEQELARNPDDASVLRAFAAVARDSGDRRSAIRGYALVLSHDPDDRDALIQLQRLAPSQLSAADRPPGTAAAGDPSPSAEGRSSSASTDPPRPPTDWRNLVGLVQKADRRTDRIGQAIQGRLVVNLVVRPHPKSGEQDAIVGVELSGVGGIKGGDVQPGEWIEVDRRARTAHGAYVTKRLLNLTTGAQLKGRHQWLGT